jgi:transcriptional regulator with XRE-family HTH domain
MPLGDRIRQACEQAGISQAELARRIGISKNAMNAIEAGDTDPRASRIVAIAQELGVSTDALLLGRQATGSRARKPTVKRQRTRQAAPVVEERPHEHQC